MESQEQNNHNLSRGFLDSAIQLKKECKFAEAIELIKKAIELNPYESLNFFHGRLLYSVLSKYLKDLTEIGSISIFETGTARGFSSICMAKALIDMNSPGFITTIDSIPHENKIYWN